MESKWGYKRVPGIKTPQDLGNAYLGNPATAIVPPKCPIDRAEYGRSIAADEGGIFTPLGYIIPTKRRRRIFNVT